MSPIPPRVRLDRMTTAERFIYAAVQELARVGADVRLGLAIVARSVEDVEKALNGFIGSNNQGGAGGGGTLRRAA